MSLLENLVKPETILPCKVRATLNELSQEDRPRLEAAIADHTWPAETLANQLNSLGIELSATRLRQHRKQLCSCSRI